MKYVDTIEYRAIRDLRVEANEGGPVLETLAAGCVIILTGALCSVVSCLLWPTVVPRVAGSLRGKDGSTNPVLPYRMLRRRLVLEFVLLIIPFQMLLSSGTPFWGRSDEREFANSLKAEYSHSLFILPMIRRVLSAVFDANERDGMSTPPYWFTFELLIWVLLALCVVFAVVKHNRFDTLPPLDGTGIGIANAWRQDFTVYRGSLMMMTCLSILAVDFSFFPSRFMKTEAFGVSLMDIGVGSFMLSGGIGGAPRAAEISSLLVQWIYWGLGLSVPREVSSLSSLESPAIGLAVYLRQTKIAKRLLRQRTQGFGGRGVAGTRLGSLGHTDSISDWTRVKQSVGDVLLDVIPPSQQLQQITEDIASGKLRLGGEGVPDETVRSSLTVRPVPGLDCEMRRRSFELFRRFFSPSLSLIGLGLCRTFAVYIFDHPQHVTEYGVHWNFFFTLAMLPPGYVLMNAAGILFAICWGLLTRPLLGLTERRFTPGYHMLQYLHVFPNSHLFRTFLCIIGHQSLLCFTGLTPFIFSDDRNGIFAANKEGLCSIFGFVAIYSAGVDIGTMLRGGTRPTSNTARRWGLLLCFVMSMALYWIFEFWVQRASRRLCNAGFIFFAVGFNALSGFCLACVPYTVDGLRPKAVLLDAVSSNQLVIFLVSNLLVGLLNQATQTIFVSSWISHALLVGYALYGCVLGWKMKRSGIVIK